MRVLLLVAACCGVFYGGGIAESLAADPPVLVAAAPAGATACEYVGAVVQDDKTFVVFGYLTHVRGLEDARLFTDPDNRNEQTARFTFYSETKMTGRSQAGNLFVVSVEGTMTIYLREAPQPAADLEQAKFEAFRGTPVAFGKVRGQSIVNVTQPNAGVTTANLQVTQLAANPFEFDGKSCQLGGKHYEYRFSHTGFGKRTQEEPVIATLWIAGHAIAVQP